MQLIFFNWKKQTKPKFLWQIRLRLCMCMMENRLHLWFPVNQMRAVLKQLLNVIYYLQSSFSLSPFFWWIWCNTNTLYSSYYYSFTPSLVSFIVYSLLFSFLPASLCLLSLSTWLLLLQYICLCVLCCHLVFQKDSTRVKPQAISYFFAFFLFYKHHFFNQTFLKVQGSHSRWSIETLLDK